MIYKRNKETIMKFNKTNDKVEDIVKNYFASNNIILGYCKYSNKLINRIGTEKWRDGDVGIDSLYTDFNDMKIDFEFDKESKHSSSGYVTILRKDIPIRDNTGLSLNKTDWKSHYTNLARTNIIDTTKLFYNKLYYSYDEKELKTLEETEKFLNIFAEKVVGNKQFTKDKMRTLLNTIIKRSFGFKTDYVGVFTSLEGTGKSEFVTGELFKCFKDNQLFNDNAKLNENEWVFKDILANYIVTYIEESGIGEKAHNQFKNYTSLVDFKIKPKGSNYEVEKTSRSVMIFSTNDKQFIYGKDKKNRRFLVFDLADNELNNRVDDEFISIFKDVDFEKMWAEQYQYYLDGIKFLLDWDKLISDNKKYVVKTSFQDKDKLAVSILEDEIFDFENGIDVWLSASDVLCIIKDDIEVDIEFDKNDQNAVTKALARSTNDEEKKISTELKLPNIEIMKDKLYDNKRSLRRLIPINKEIYNNYTLKDASKVRAGDVTTSKSHDLGKIFDWTLEQRKK